MRTCRNIIFVLVTVFAIFVQLANPTLVRADDGTPPPPAESGTEVAPLEEPVELSAEEPLTEELPVELPVATEEPVETEVPSQPAMDSDPADDPNTPTEPAAPGETSLLESIQEVPEQTDIVVLDETGDVVPLATQEAAEIIAVNDPVWCPGTQAPTPTTLGCSASYPSLSALVAGFVPTANGTIWIQSGTDTGGNVIIDGTGSWSLASTYSLALQGGWSGVSGDTSIGSNSIFSVPISITNWTGAVTVNNITVTNPSGTGLTVTNAQDVTITNSTFVNNHDYGVYMDNLGVVTINDSLFRGNGWVGLDLAIFESVTVAGSTFTGNYVGLGISNTNNMIITNSVFNQNTSDGAYITNVTVANITGSTFDGNHTNGARLEYVDSASITNNTFSENDGAGLTINSFTRRHTIATLENNTFSQNNTGIDAIAEPATYMDPAGSIDLTLKCNTFQGTGTDIKTEGNVTVTINPCGASDPDPIPILSSPNFVDLVIDCSRDSSFLAQWASGDQVLLSCVNGGTARLWRMENTMLPGDMPAGFEYASGFLIEIFQDGVPLDVLTDGGFVQIGFASRHENPQYGIMYWDEVVGDWILIKDFQSDAAGGSVSFPLHSSNQQDQYKVLSGVHLVVDGNWYREEVTTNFPGIFVLAQK